MEKPEGSRLNVLVIENEPFFLRLLSQFLTTAGYRVEVAADAREGIKRFEQSRFDAVVIDFLLGELTGWEVIKAIRGKDSVVGTILLSAVAEQLNRDVVRARGFDLILDKPVEANVLREAVAEVSRLKAARLAAIGRDKYK